MPRVHIMLARCTATVFALTSSCAAISLFDFPSTMSCRTSSSRAVNPARRSPFNAGASDNSGSSTVSPAAARFTAATRSRSTALLSTYPRAPASSAWRTSVSSECMLSIRTATSGEDSRILRVAVSPLTPGSAQSITITLGLSSPANRMASFPLAASPTTEISGSSSRSRRRPRRTRLWSSTSNTVISLPMQIPSFSRHFQEDARASFGRTDEIDGPAEQLGAFAHGDDADPAQCVLDVKPRSVVLHFEIQSVGLKTQPDPSFLHSRMADDVVQRLLEHAIHVDSPSAIDGKRGPRLLVSDHKPGLPFHRLKVPVERALQ